MQTTIGNLLNAVPTPAIEASSTVPTDAGALFSTIYAREMQQAVVVEASEEHAVPDSAGQPDQGQLPLISVEERSVEAGLLAGVWAILEEVAPLQEVAATTGENLPDELTNELVDTAFELGRLADELSSALVQKPIYDAINLEPAVDAVPLDPGAAVSGLLVPAAMLTPLSEKSGYTPAALSVASRGTTPGTRGLEKPEGIFSSAGFAGLPGASIVAPLSMEPGSPTAGSQAIAEVLNRLRSLLDAAKQNTLVNPVSVPTPGLTAESAVLPEGTEFSGPALDRLTAISQDPLSSQGTRPVGRDTLQVLSAAPTLITALPTGVAGLDDLSQVSNSVSSMPIATASSIAATDTIAQMDRLLSQSPAELVRMHGSPDKSVRSLTIDQAINDVVDVDSLLDDGFKIQDLGTAIMRESNALSTAGLASLDNLIRAGAGADSRLPGAEANSIQQPNADKPAVAEPRPVIATAKVDVWLRNTEELPDHILAHVGRMHAQSLRFNAAGFTDLVQRMTLSLHPDDLGQVDVQMRAGEQMSLVFHAREGATRDLLEQNISRLRQMFDAQGISLGDISVGTGSGSDRQTRDEASNGLFRQLADGGSGVGQDRPAGARPSATSDRLIDIRA